MTFDLKDNEIWKKNNEYLEKKRQEAIQYLGDKWILKGGKYNRDNIILKNEVKFNENRS